MKKSLMVIILLIFSLLTLNSAHTASRVKAGAKCIKQGSTTTENGKRYTCIKSGNRLVWNKGIAEILRVNPPPTPTVSAPAEVKRTPNPFEISPFPDEFTRVDMVAALFKSFDNYIKSNSSIKPFKLVIDPDFQNDSEAITALVKDVYSVLPFPADYPMTVVVVSQDKNLLEKSIQDFGGFDRTGSNPNDWHICLNCGGLGWASIKNGLSSVTPHEIFHVWQKAAYKRVNDNNPDPNNPLNSPVWFDEGGADFFGEAIFSKTSKTYQVPRVRWQQNYRLKDYATRNIDPSLPYSLGRAASEYIVASKGMEKFLEVYLNVGKGQDFPTAFFNALGITLEDFYSKFDKNLEKML